MCLSLLLNELGLESQVLVAEWELHELGKEEEMAAKAGSEGEK